MRKNYIDWLRNGAILFLFPYHTARIFDDISPFYIKGAASTFPSILVHLSFWFMPLLFLLSGMSSLHALRNRSTKNYLKERHLRLMVPFVFGVLVIVPPQAYFAKRFHRDQRESYLDFLKNYFTDFSDWSEYAGGISPAHLWFILFLFLISIALLPVMAAAIRNHYSPAWLGNPALVILPFAGLALLSALPDISGKNIFVYAAYFILGFFMATDDRITTAIEKHRRIHLGTAVVGSAGILLEIFTIGGQSGMVFTIWHFLTYWASLLAILGYGKRYLDRRSRLVSYFNPAAFPVYILHQTYLVIVGYHVLQVTDRGIVPFLIIMLVSLFLSIATYDVIRRIPPIRILFGLK
ncbi:acyltransferase family protein [Streptosporangium sp. NPDC002607]